ncbi:MAG: DUF433 domain-containing protein [Actinobacteria bacterium]|nr:DUF433 domain-containing protein [Actinomycetota bacterium]
MKVPGVRVIDIAIEYDKLGYSPDQIADAHPRLDLYQIHDALSYYYEHQTELDAEIVSRRRNLEELRVNLFQKQIFLIYENNKNFDIIFLTI